MSGLVVALIGIAIAVILAGTGSAIGVAGAGQTADGVMSEEPELFGKLLLLVALPGTQGIYGFLVGFMSIMKLGLISGDPQTAITVSKGLEFLVACLPVGVTGLFSAIHQGYVCSTGVTLVAKQREQMGKALVLGVFVEFYAILGLIASILLVNSIQM
jgi:V/A-type H+-transporting ATPase subunit K